MLWICHFKPDGLCEEFQLPANLEQMNILAVGYSKDGMGDPDRFDIQRFLVGDAVLYEV